MLQGLKEPEVLLTVDVKRLATLRQRGKLEPHSVVQLDLYGELIPVVPKRVALDPVSGVPTALVLCRTGDALDSLEKEGGTVEYPDALYPLGWHHKVAGDEKKKD